MNFRFRLKSFRYAFNGIKEALNSQANLFVHCVATCIVVAMGAYVELNRCEWMAIVIACGFVWATEIINTSIEYLTDLVSPNYHEKAGKVKDLAAGAVLVAAITAGIIGLLIFVPHLLALIPS